MRTYLLEIKYEFLKALRMPQYSLPTILFPIVFYIFFGVVFGGRNTGGVKMAEYLIATYGAFGVIESTVPCVFHEKVTAAAVRPADAD